MPAAAATRTRAAREREKRRPPAAAAPAAARRPEEEPEPQSADSLRIATFARPAAPPATPPPPAPPAGGAAPPAGPPAGNGAPGGSAPPPPWNGGPGGGAVPLPRPAARVRTLRRACASCGGATDHAGPGIDLAWTVRRCPACGGALGRGEAAPGGCTCPQGRAASMVADTLRSGGAPLAPATRGFFEERFAHPLADVRVHTGDRADRSARAVDALAYTVGSDVVFRAGYFAPSTAPGQRLLAHELAHVVQQGRGGGRRLATVAAGELRVGHADDPLEREADRAAAAVLAPRPARPALSAAGPRVQRQEHPPAPPQQPGAAPAATVDRTAVNAAVDLILDRLEGYTSGSDSHEILAQFTGRDAATVRAIMDELQRRGSGNVAWLFEDMTAEDGRDLRRLLIRLHASSNILQLVAADIVSRLRGWTSEDDSHEILSDLNGFGGGELDALLAETERQAAMDEAGLGAWLFGDLDRVSGSRLGDYLYAAGTPKAVRYAAAWTVDRVYSLLSGYTSHTDSTSIVSALRQVPAEQRPYVQFRLDQKCRAERGQSVEDSLMHDMDAADYNAVRDLDGFTLRPYDRQPSMLEAGWEALVSGLDYGFVLVQWVACGVAGIVTGVLSVVWDLVVLVKDIVVAVWDLLGSLVYLLSGGAAGSAEWLAVKEFFIGIGHLFTDPGAVFEQMWGQLRAEFDTIEGPLTQCRRAEFIVRKFINALVNIILIFVAGYGAVKLVAKGVQGVAEFAALVREVGLAGAIAEVSGEAARGVRAFVAVSATRAAELAEALRSPLQTLARVRGEISAVLMAAEDQGYWRFLRTQAGRAVRGGLEEEGRFWRERRDYWRETGRAQQAGEAAISDELRPLDSGVQRQTAPENADRLIADASERARALQGEADDLHGDVTGRREPVEPPAGEGEAPRREPEAPPERPGGAGPEADPLAEGAHPERGIRAEAETPDHQHEVKVQNDGELLRCSDHCSIMRYTHRDLLARRPDLERTLQRIEALAAGDDRAAAESVRQGALFDQRLRGIGDLQALGEDELRSRIASRAGTAVERDELRFELARRRDPTLTFDRWLEQSIRWPPAQPAGPKPGIGDPGAAEWRYRRYVYEAWEEGAGRDDVLDFDTWRRRHFETSASGGRPGRPGGPEQVRARQQLASQEGFQNVENIELGGRYPDMVRDNAAGGRDYVEVGEMLQSGIPEARERVKLVDELPELGRNDTLTFVDKNDISNRVTYRPRERPAVVHSRRSTRAGQ